MSKIEIKSLLQEQKICITCGLCCDGTLFGNAGLNPGEKGKLPEKIEQNYFKVNGKEYFRLPCKYFNKKCTIYDKKKAIVCSSYRCQLLVDFAEKKKNLDQCLELVRQAKLMRDEMLGQYKMISGNSSDIKFRQVLIEVGKIIKDISKGETVSKEYEIFIASCNILEALLIKHFRSSQDFDNMSMAIR